MRASSLSWMSWEKEVPEVDLRNFLWLEGLDKVGGWGADMEVVGERSRSGSECSEERAVEDQEERLADVMKGGRGGVRQAESSGEYSYGS